MSTRPRPDRHSSVAILLALLFGIAFVLSSMLGALFPDYIPEPAPSGVPLVGVAMVATFASFYLNDLLSADGQPLEKASLEVMLVAVGALLSLAVLQYYKGAPLFTGGVGLLKGLGVEVAGEGAASSRRAAWTLSAVAVLLAACSFGACACLARERAPLTKLMLKAASVVVILTGYTLFLVTLLYADAPQRP